MPELDQQDRPRRPPQVPGLVLEAVIEHEAAALLPGRLLAADADPAAVRNDDAEVDEQPQVLRAEMRLEVGAGVEHGKERGLAEPRQRVEHGRRCGRALAIPGDVLLIRWLRELVLEVEHGPVAHDVLVHHGRIAAAELLEPISRRQQLLELPADDGVASLEHLDRGELVAGMPGRVAQALVPERRPLERMRRYQLLAGEEGVEVGLQSAKVRGAMPRSRAFEQVANMVNDHGDLARWRGMTAAYSNRHGTCRPRRSRGGGRWSVRRVTP